MSSVRPSTVAVLAIVCIHPLLARADISGFSGFDVVNKFVNSVPSTNPNVGYSGDSVSFHLTDPVNSQQTSGYHATPQAVTSFTTSFNYQSIPTLYNGGPNLIAGNGIAFNLINAPTGTATLANVGNADSMGIRGVTQSAGLLFNNFGGAFSYAGSVLFQTGGNVPNPTPASAWKELPKPGLASGSVHNVSARYTDGIFRYTITDTANGKTFKSAVNVDIAAAVGGTTALVGFSGSTGGYNSDQTVSSFQFMSGTGSGYIKRVVSPTAVYTPIALSGGFNQTVVVPNIASIAPTGADAIGYITATPDNGTNVSGSSSGSTYYESGLGGTPAGSGLPTSGSVFTSQVDARHTFRMPTYNTTPQSGQTPDALTLYTPTRGANATSDTSGELTFAVPSAYTGLSLLLAAGNGPADVAVVVHYADGTMIDLGDAVARDWFNQPNQAWNAQARVNPATRGVGIGAFGLYQADLALPLNPTAISRIELNLDGLSDTRSVATIFAVSGVASSIWAAPTGGEWDDATSWANGLPDGVDASANFGTSILANSSINLSSHKTVGAIAFENPAAYTIRGTGTLTVDVAGGAAPITVVRGSHTVDVLMILTDSTNVTTYNGGSLTFAKPVALAANQTLTTSGLVTFSGTVDGAPGSALAVLAGTTTFSATQRLPSVTIAPGATALVSDVATGTILRTETLIMTAGGKLDLGDNSLILDYSTTSPLAGVRDLILSGYNAAGTHWTGNGIMSSVALADPKFSIGFAEANTIANPFTNETLDGTAVIVRVTFRGDANLDGIVGFDDLLALAQSYGGTDKSWAQGDFNYDTSTDFDDLLSLAQNYNQSLLAGTASPLNGDFLHDFALAQSLVPEPTSTISALSLALLGVGRRRALLPDVSGLDQQRRTW